MNFTAFLLKSAKYFVFYALFGIELGYSQKKDYIESALNHIQIGDSLTDAKQPEKGLSEYQKAEKLYITNQDAPRLAYVYRYLVRHLDISGKFQEAANLLKKGEKILESSKSKTDSAAFWIYSKLATEYQRLEKFDSCNIYFDKTQAILKRNPTPDLRGVMFFYANLGTYEMTYGNYTLAHQYYQKSISIANQNPSLQKHKNTILANFIRCLTLEKKSNIAEKYINELLLNNQDSPTRYNQILLLGISYTDQKKYAEAYRRLREANEVYQVSKKISKENENLDFEREYHHQLASVLFKQEKIEEAEKELNITIKLIHHIYGNRGYELSEALRFLAKIHLKKHRIDESLKWVQQAIIASHLNFSSPDIYKNPDLVGVKYKWVMFRALDVKSEALYEKYKSTLKKQDLALALNTAKLGAELAINIRKSYQSPVQKASFTEFFYPFYIRNLEIAQKMNNLGNSNRLEEDFFTFSEKMRATALGDIINENLIKPKSVSASLLQIERRIQQEITNLEYTIQSIQDSSEVSAVQNTIAEKQIELNKLLKKIEKESPSYYQLKYQQSTENLNNIKHHILDKESALVSYVVSEKKIYIQVISQTTSKIFDVKIDSNFVKYITFFKSVLSISPRGKKYEGYSLSTELYKILISPIEKEIADKKRLIIIRDAELNYLPFEVLAKQKNDFLLKKHIISYGYSASLLLPTMQQGKQGSGLLGFAPFANNNFQQSLFRDKNLGQLPKSGSEVEKIGGDIYLENEATKKRFYEKYREKNIIHFATHAITDDTDPLKSFIAFYPDNADYKLFTSELYDLDLRNTSLVMLSACETGAGKLQKGEGVMSLSRAFTYAGAKAVVTTLWNAHDEASAYISERFYKHLKDGLKTDEALQKAKIDFLNSDLALRYEHPYYWANFILIGPAETIDFGTYWWIWVVITCILLGGYLFYRMNGYTILR